MDKNNLGVGLAVVALSGASIGWLASAARGPRICFAPPGEGDGGGADGGGGTGGQGAGGEGGGAEGGGGDGGLFKPEGMPEGLLGATDRETLERVYGELKTVNEANAARGTVPEKADGYVFTPSDDLKPYTPDLEKDPFLKAAQVSAHKHGMTAEQFQGFVQDFFGSAKEGGFLLPPYEPVAELKAYGKAHGFPDTKEGRAQLDRQVSDVTTFADGFVEQLKLPDGAKAEFLSLLSTSDGMLALDGVRSALEENGMKVGGEGGGGSGWTKERLQQAQSDPRIDPTSSKFDPAFRKEFDVAYKKIHGA